MEKTVEKKRFRNDLIIAVVTVILALLVNTWHEDQVKKKSFETMTKAIAAEANSNLNTYRESFKPQIEDSNGKLIIKKIIIYRDFKIKIAEDCLGNDNFMSNVDPSTIQALNEYVSELKRMNAFRGAYQKYLEDAHTDTFLVTQARASIYRYLDQDSVIIKKIETLKF